MLKSIPKSNISRRSFKVYKKWNADESQYPVIKAYNVDGLFDSDTSPTDEGVFVHLLYQSIKKKYYTDNGLIMNYGTLDNPVNFSSERSIGDDIFVITLDRDKVGEKIKPGSFNLEINNVTYVDDGNGRVVNPNPTYIFSSLDIENNSLIITNGIDEYDVTISSIDYETGITILTFNGDTDDMVLAGIDLEAGTISFTSVLNFAGLKIQNQSYGNVFHSDGIIVLTNVSDFSEYNLEYRSTTTIHETEILLEAKAGEFNYSQNPSAVNVTLSGSYDFTTTPIPNVSPAKTIKIKEVQDISLRNEYNGTIGSNVGTWDDYSVSSSMDPSGSFLAPMVSTIGIYDKDGDMVAVAKLPQPIKNLPDYDVNFIVRFDT
jgi:hypothetical protein